MLIEPCNRLCSVDKNMQAFLGQETSQSVLRAHIQALDARVNVLRFKRRHHIVPLATPGWVLLNFPLKLQ